VYYLHDNAMHKELAPVMFIQIEKPERERTSWKEPHFA
jgi:hypothetical protein